MKKLNVTARVVLTSVALTPAILFSGCEPKKSPQDNAPVTQVDQRPDAVKKPESKPSSSVDRSDLDEAAKVLGRATNQFVDVFSEEKSGVESEGDGSSFALDLVDDDVKRKYSDDRSMITPGLTERADDLADAPKYRLAYRFTPNRDLAWNVVYLVRKRVSYGGVEKLIETSSTTWRRWEFQDATSDGKVKGRHWIDRMILHQNEEGKEPVDYDSDRDLVVPKEIAAFGTEKAVGVVLETFEINPLGVMSDKKKLIAEYQGREGDSSVMVPFPDEELAVGDVWTVPYTLYLKGSDDVPHPCRIVERFRLDKIDDRYATVTFKTTLVSIVDDPVIEGALAERLFTGRVLFDRELGQAARTELNFKKTVPGAYGIASFLEYNCQVTEKLDRQKSGFEDVAEQGAEGDAGEIDLVDEESDQE